MMHGWENRELSGAYFSLRGFARPVGWGQANPEIADCKLFWGSRLQSFAAIFHNLLLFNNYGQYAQEYYYNKPFFFKSEVRFVLRGCLEAILASMTIHIIVRDNPGCLEIQGC